MKPVQISRTKAFDRVNGFFSRVDIIWWVYVAAAIIVSLVQYFKGAKPLYGEGYTHYNNFLIFKYSFFNLLDHQNLYLLHPDQFFDYYKYSPTFALLMAPMAILPDLPGLILWNALNTLPLFMAIKLLPSLRPQVKGYILWLLLLDTMTSLHNSQSNGLMAALFIIAFNCFESRRVVWAAFCIVLSVYIKLFGVVFAVMFLMYPQRAKFLAASLGWSVGLGLLPLIAGPPSWLISLYQSWLALLTTDFGAHYGVSLFGILNKWFGLHPSKTMGILVGGFLLALPLLRVAQYRHLRFRQMFFASLLIWVIIFNHKAESATFIIAMCGIVIWYFAGEPRLSYRILLGLAFVLISLSPTDLFPRSWRGELVIPYVLKAFPAVIVWGVLQAQLLLPGYSPAHPTSEPGDTTA